MHVDLKPNTPVVFTNPADSGVTADSNRETTFPLRSTRNLVKFHLISPAFFGSVALPVRYL